LDFTEKKKEDRTLGGKRLVGEKKKRGALKTLVRNGKLQSIAQPGSKKTGARKIIPVWAVMGNVLTISTIS